MSSESDEDFLSADEGSDVEDSEIFRTRKQDPKSIAQPPKNLTSDGRKEQDVHLTDEEVVDVSDRESTDLSPEVLLDESEISNRREDTLKDMHVSESEISNREEESPGEIRDSNSELSKGCEETSWETDHFDDVNSKQEKKTKSSSLIGALNNLSLQVNEQLSNPNKLSQSLIDVECDDVENLEPLEKGFESIEKGSESLEVFGSETFSERQQLSVKGVLDQNVESSKTSPLLTETHMEKVNETENIQVATIKTNEKVLEAEKLFSEKDPDVADNGSKISNKTESFNEENTTFDPKPPVQEDKINNYTDLEIQQEKVIDEPKPEESKLPTQKVKPMKESRIGMKKPREKLGEKLGARKLGSRVEKKEMEGIGSDKSQGVSAAKSNLPTDLKATQSLGRKDNERQKQDTGGSFWENEERRWQQVQNFEGKGKMESSKNREAESDWGSSWGNWGTTLVSAASTFTQEVGRGVGSIIETVEGNLGVPDPETMAREIKEREREMRLEVKQRKTADDRDVSRNETLKQNDSSISQNYEIPKEYAPAPSSGSEADFGFGGLSSLGSLVSGVSGVFETASNKVLMGGLDTLEVIGRKAMDAIQDGDPGLRKKRAFLTSSKPNLSSALQEARHRAAEEERDQREGGSGTVSLGYQSVRPTLDQAWDASEGCVHLEALSLVSRQCESKMSSLLQNMPHYLVERIQAANNEIKATCDLEDDEEGDTSAFNDDFISKFEDIIPQIGLSLQPQKICNAWKSIEETVVVIKDAGVIDGPTGEREFYSSLVLLIGQLVAVIHKGAELALITPEVDPIDVAAHFRQLCSVMCGAIESIADQICSIITTGSSAANPQMNNTITNIYLQSSDGNRYIQQSMTYLSSILQYANVKLMSAEL